MCHGLLPVVCYLRNWFVTMGDAPLSCGRDGVVVTVFFILKMLLISY